MKEELISAVESVPALWDKCNKQHHHRHVLEREWKKIAFHLGTTDKHVRHVWKNLRQEFGKQLRRTLPSGSAAPDIPNSTWPYFQSLLFLTGQFIPRPSSGNLKSNFDDNSIQGHGSEDEGMMNSGMNGSINSEYGAVPVNETEPSCSQPSSPTDVTPHPQVTQKKNTIITKTGYVKRVTPQTVIGQQLLEIEKEKLKLKQTKLLENVNDEDVGFFNSILPHVRKLTPRDKLRFRMQVQNILFDMAYPTEHSVSSDTTVSPFYCQPISASAFVSHEPTDHDDGDCYINI